MIWRSCVLPTIQIKLIKISKSGMLPKNPKTNRNIMWNKAAFSYEADSSIITMRYVTEKWAWFCERWAAQQGLSELSWHASNIVDSAILEYCYAQPRHHCGLSSSCEIDQFDQGKETTDSAGLPSWRTWLWAPWHQAFHPLETLGLRARGLEGLAPIWLWSEGQRSKTWKWMLFHWRSEAASHLPLSKIPKLPSSNKALEDQ